MNKTQAAPLIPHTPPADEAEALNLFARARNGDAEALKRVQQLLHDRKWTTWLGDVGHQATMQLLAHVVEGDPVNRIAVLEQVKELVTGLLGENPSVLEQLLVRSVINAWLAANTLLLEQAVRPQETLERRDYLDRAVSRAQSRFLEAIHELARVRRLQAPRVLRELVRRDDGDVRNLIPMNGKQAARDQERLAD